MKYQVHSWTRGKDYWFTVSPTPYEELKPLVIADNAHNHIVATVHFTPANKDEMRQHAKKLADYFEAIDIQKEAVINCSKI